MVRSCTATILLVVFLVKQSTSSLNRNDAKRIIEQSARQRPPVIIAPGFQGNQLEAKLDKPNVVSWLCSRRTADWFSIWFELQQVVPIAMDCLLDNMKMRYNRTTRHTVNAPGVQIRPTAFGQTEGIEYASSTLKADIVSYYGPIINALVSVGYQRNVNIRAASTDWRRAPYDDLDYCVNLANLVEQTYADNRDTAIIIVCHSIGCLNSLYCLQHQKKDWKKTYIRAFITLAAPWGGALKTIRAIVPGDTYFPFNMVSVAKVLPIVRSWSVSYFGLPSRSLANMTKPFLTYDGRDYTTDDYELLFSKLNYTEGREMWYDSKNALTRQHPGVNIICIHGKSVDTLEKLVYKRPADFPDNPVLVDTLRQGDGSMSKESLEGCLQWNSSDEFSFEYKTLVGLEHVEAATDFRVLEWIISAVAGYMTM